MDEAVDPAPGGHRRRPRVALYGHDTCGLGHLRRNLALAAAMRAGASAPDVLVLSGSSQAQRFPRPDGVELVVLPTVVKSSDGSYAAGALDVPLEDVVGLRSAIASGVLAAWAPDLLVVDKVPGGFGGELLDALADLREAGTRIVLGLRDVLDDPVTTAAEWERDRGARALDRFYDEVWVYGDAAVHDLREDLRLRADQARRTRFLGYLAQGRPEAAAEPLPRRTTGTRTVVASVGGGGDGADLARALLAAPLPTGVDLVLLPGPFAGEALREDLAAAGATRPDLHVVGFSDAVGAWVAEADAVVCMGGYNSVAEVLATDTPALVVPRTRPRREQQVRADGMAAHGLVDVGTADPGRIGDWIAATLADPRARARSAAARGGAALDGLAGVTRRTEELLRPRVARPRAVPDLVAVPAPHPTDVTTDRSVPRAC